MKPLRHISLHGALVRTHAPLERGVILAQQHRGEPHGGPALTVGARSNPRVLFHGGNRGSNPLGDANKISSLEEYLTVVSNKCPIKMEPRQQGRWRSVDQGTGSRLGLAMQRGVSMGWLDPAPMFSTAPFMLTLFIPRCAARG